MALTIQSLNFDKTLYVTGDTIHLTVDYTSTDVVSGSAITSAVAVTVSDTASTASTSSNFSVNDGPPTAEPTTVSATDNRTAPGVWSVSSNVVSGTAPTFTGVAVLTSLV